MTTRSGSRGSDPKTQDEEAGAADNLTAELPANQIQIQMLSPQDAAAKPGAEKGIHSDSFHRRIHEDYHHQHQIPSRSVALGEESFEDWAPASLQRPSGKSAGGWSYSEGDEVNVPETSLSLDAQFSQIEAAANDGDVAAQQQLKVLLEQRYGPGGYTIISKKTAGKPTRKPVDKRYPMPIHQTQQPMSPQPSVCQPMPPAPPASFAMPKSGGAGAGTSVPTPHHTNPGDSSVQRNLTPEEKQAMEGRKKAALARRMELESERAKKVVARNLNFDANTHQVQQYQQQQGMQPLLQPPTAQNIVVQAQAPLPNITTTAATTALNPSQAQRAEANRQRALNIRQNKLMEEAVALAHAALAALPPSGGGGGGGAPSGIPPNLIGRKARIEEDVRNLLSAQRYSSHDTHSSATASQLSPPPTAGGNASGASGIGSQLSPEQRQRIEANRQRALQRQKDKIEHGLVAFTNAAMQRAQYERGSFFSSAVPTGQQRQQLQRQQQQASDQMALRFL
jgi:hypothetical protein